MRALLRLLQVAGALGGFALWWLLVRAGWLRPRQGPGERLRDTLQGLGTTFVKLGQALSIRADLLPPEHVRALQGLQDRVPPFPAAEAVAAVEAALGRPLEELFAHFEHRPLAAASIAQVHRARLRDGRRAVVKVRRPGIMEQVARDMRLLRWGVRLAAALFPALERYRLPAVVQEIAAELHKELDLRREARNMRLLAEALRAVPGVHVPAVIDELYAEAVIVQEESLGRRIDDPAVRPQGPRLVRVLLDAYLHQILVLGVFHGDPHPGNLYVLPDGRLCLHDFGIVGTLDPATRAALAGYLQALLSRDSAWLLEAYLELGVVEGAVDRALLRQRLHELLQEYAGLPMRDWSLAEILLRTARMGLLHNVRLPHHLLVLARTVLLLENDARILDPGFDPVGYLVARGRRVARAAVQGEAEEAARRRLRHEAALALHQAPERLAAFLAQGRRQGWRLPVDLRGLEQLEGHIDRASNRVALALVALGLYIAASLLAGLEGAARLLGLPWPALLLYALALWFTLRLVRGIARSGRL
ncbi:MAG: AarF/ABC1/UbiB kinase family protein [Gammaproteobacteria bacterium]|nr:MAG: AarF/ABC1/UbiB kinase family protein [Gammaproteobacteria bacterium]